MTTAEIVIAAIANAVAATTATATVADVIAIANAVAATTASFTDALANANAIANAVVATTATANALAAALVEADEDEELVDHRNIAGLVTIEAGDEATAIANAFDGFVDAVDTAISRFPAWQDPDGVRAAIVAWRRLDLAVSRLRLRLGQTVTTIRVETEARLKRRIEPTPKSEVRAHALAAEAAAEAAGCRPMKAELAASGWFAAGDVERGRLWLNRAKTRRWFATDFE